MATPAYGAFLAQLRSGFRLQREGSEPVGLELTEVSERRSNGTLEAFSLTFQGPLEPALEQGTYRLENDAMGAFEIFLVPIRRDATGFGYEAVFNRSIPPA